MCSTNTLGQSLGKKTLAEITSQDLDLWMTAQLEAGYKPATVNKHSSILNRILNIAVQWGYLDTNPFKAVVIKKLPTGDYGALLNPYGDQKSAERL